jgi:UDP-sugar transporter A1/2/3
MPKSKAQSSSGSNTGALSRQAIFYMALLTIQFGCQPMLTAKFTPKTACRTSIIIVQESIKFIIASTMLFASGSRNVTQAFQNWTILSWIQVAFVPAFLYTIQNQAALLAYQNLDGVTFVVLNQTKTLSAALCCYLIIGRKQSGVQILSLMLLLVSALIMENLISMDYILNLVLAAHEQEEGAARVEENHLSPSLGPKHITHGVAPVLLASFLSGLAGAISQKNLQSSSGRSSGGRNPYLFSSELCIASLVLLSISLKFSQDGKMIQEFGFFHEWTVQTLIPIVSNAMGGIVVGLVTKYAGSVRKGFALIFGMLFTGLIQSMAGGDGSSSGGGGGVAVSKEQIIGGLIASASLWMHATHPYVDVGGKNSDAKKKKD